MGENRDEDVDVERYRFWSWVIAADVADRLNAGEDVYLGHGPACHGAANLEPGWHLERKNSVWEVVGDGF